MRVPVRWLLTGSVAAALVAPVAVGSLDTASAASTISGTAFGMHYLSAGHRLVVPLGTARLWGGDVPTWAQLQPKAPDPAAGIVPTEVGGVSSTGFDESAAAQLDAFVLRYNAAGVEPLITLGMTPTWAATGCNHGSWPESTCPPVDSVGTWGDPWAKYVDWLATRYDGQNDYNHHAKVTYFELWNEPSLASSYNGTIAKLAQMQSTAHTVLRSHNDVLVSPSIPFTNGHAGHEPVAGQHWLDTFLGQPGGTDYDITGLHLYPADAAVRAGYGPEWSVNVALPTALGVLRKHGVAGRAIWDTEHNVGRAPAHTGYGAGAAGAAAVARTFILATENHIARTIWYAADDRSWGGTWLENAGLTGLSTAGRGYRTVRALLVGKTALGCARTTVGRNMWRYTCAFGTSTGHRTLLAIWTNGRSYTLRAPAGTSRSYSVTGARRGAHRGQAFRISGTPVYLSGSFRR